MTGGSGDNFGYAGTDYSHIPISGSYSSVQFPDNYQPTPKPDANFKYDYDYDYEKLSNPMHDIENIRLMIKAQQPGTISTLADHWVKVVQLLDTVKKTVASNADALHDGDHNGFGGWSSPAANEFLRWGPGATLYSIQQWTDAAQANVRALRNLADAVWQAHIDIDLAWQDYVDEAKADKAKLMEGWGYDPSLLPLKEQKQLPGPAANLMSQIYEHQTAIWRKWSVKAQGIAYELSQKFYAQLEGDLIAGRGTRFEGPSNAVVANPMLARMRMPAGGRAPALGRPAAAPPPAASPPPASPPPAAPPVGSAPPADITKTPPALQQLGDLADAAQQAALAPPPPPITSQMPALLPLGALALSPDTAQLLGLAPLTTAASPTGLFGSRPGAPGASGGLPEASLRSPGVLRSGAGATARANPTPPGGLGRGVSRLGNTAGRRSSGPGAGEDQAARSSGPLDEPFERPGAGASPSVLGGRRTTGVPEESQFKAAPSSGSPLRPGMTPSVVKRSAAPPAEDAGAFEDPVRPPGTSAPSLSSPGVVRSRSTTAPVAEEPGAQLRGARTGTPSTPSELGSRHRARPEAGRVGEQTAATTSEDSTVVGDEAWAVATPGGSLLTSRTEQPAYEAEHRPALGGGGS